MYESKINDSQKKKKQIKKKTTKNKKKLSTEGKGNIGSKIIRIKKKH